MLGEEVGEEPRSDELQSYVHELALDVLEAAENYRWNLPGDRDPDGKMLALAKRIEAPRHAMRWKSPAAR